MSQTGNELELARRYRNFAEELRIIAADTRSADNRKTLVKLAADYEKMAANFEAIDVTNKALWKARQKLR